MVKGLPFDYAQGTKEKGRYFDKLSNRPLTN